jgi:DNA-binding FadR family transcriptional regulator
MPAAKKLYRRIADQIAEDIDQGTFVVGGRLPPERDLAVRFGVSRASVREALIALEIMGRIEARHGVGIVVTSPSEAALPISDSEIGAFELIEARRLVEGEIAAMAASLIDEEALAQLEELKIRMSHPDPDVSEEADREFHLVIARTTGNGALVATVEALWDWRYSSHLARKTLKRAADLGMASRMSEHEGVLDALKAKDPQAARLAMHSHLSRVIDDLLDATELVALEDAKALSAQTREKMSARFLRKGEG